MSDLTEPGIELRHNAVLNKRANRSQRSGQILRITHQIALTLSRRLHRLLNSHTMIPLALHDQLAGRNKKRIPPVDYGYFHIIVASHRSRLYRLNLTQPRLFLSWFAHDLGITTCLVYATPYADTYDETFLSSLRWQRRYFSFPLISLIEFNILA